MKTIPLSQGKVAIVDDDDFEWLTQWKWHYFKGTHNRTGYAVRREGGRKDGIAVYMHRRILELERGDKCMVDHIDSNGLNNRRINLRLCNASQNGSNCLKRLSYRGKKTSSRFKGVHWNKNSQKWYAYIIVNRRQKHLGVFGSEIAAAKAYDKAAYQSFGVFAATNFATSNG